MTRRPARIALLAAAIVTVGGCGSSSEPKSSGAEGTKPAPAETQAPSAGGAGTAENTIQDFAFTPETVTVEAGGKVGWTNKDSANHNVTFDDDSVKGIGNLRQGESGKVAFPKAGEYPYVCSYHPGMKGTVIVK